MKKFSFEVVIPSYNGLEILKKHLPNIISHSGKNTRITVIDDGSADATVGYLGENFKNIVCLHNQTNIGFTKSVNLGFRQTTSDLVILLNNDVSPNENYISEALKHFGNEKVFAVTLNENDNSWPKVSWRGKFQYTRGEEKQKSHFSAWASGGSAIFRKSIWDALGGFDEVYSPGYWEDIDIGWRAWKAGYQIIWEPKSLVVHQHENTFNLLNRDYLNLIKQRNELLFNWKNITDPNLHRGHLSFLIRHALTHPGYLKVIFTALKELNQISPTPGKLTDEEIFNLVNLPLSKTQV